MHVQTSTLRSMLRYTLLLLLASSARGLSDKVRQAITDKLTILPEDEEKASKTNTVLAYVTPWHGFGYDQAKKYNDKLDYISPCWFQINDDNEVSGDHDVDQQFVTDVKSNGKTRVVPRVLVNFFHFTNSGQVGKVVDRTTEDLEALAKVMLKLKNKYNFNGFVLECGWLSYLQLTRDIKSIDNNLVPTLAKFTKMLKKLDPTMKIILVVPPISRSSFRYFTAAHFSALESNVDYFSLMTYDYKWTSGMAVVPEDETVHPNAPSPWVETAVLDIVGGLSAKKQRKILMGLNFYGRYWPTRIENSLTKDGMFDYVGKVLNEPKRIDANLPDDYKHKIRMKWFKDFEEQVIHLPETEDSEKTSISFPSVRSINRRLKLAEKLNAGISIWEIGQGFDEFLGVFPERFPAKKETAKEEL